MLVLAARLDAVGGTAPDPWRMFSLWLRSESLQSFRSSPGGGGGGASLGGGGGGSGATLVLLFTPLWLLWEFLFPSAVVRTLWLEWPSHTPAMSQQRRCCVLRCLPGGQSWRIVPALVGMCPLAGLQQRQEKAVGSRPDRSPPNNKRVPRQL